jgi:hypothetical protein
MQCRGRCWHKPAVSASKFVGCVSCVSERSAAANHQQAFSLKPPDRCLRWRAATFVSELILIIRLPVRPSRLKAISMPTVLRKVWQRRNRPARARGFFGHPAVLSGTFSPAAVRARRRSEALPVHVLRTAMISHTKAATGSASMTPSIAARRLAS